MAVYAAACRSMIMRENIDAHSLGKGHPLSQYKPFDALWKQISRAVVIIC